MDYLVLFLSTVLISLFFWYLRDYFRSVFLALKLPGPPALPLLGNVLLMNNDPELNHIGKNAGQLYGKIARGWLSIIPLILVYEPDHLQTILSSNKRTKKGPFYKFLHNFLGQGLLTIDGEKWKNHRKLIQPYFHINVLEMFVVHFANGADELVKKLKGKGKININPFVNDAVLSILFKSVLGVAEEKNSPFRQGKITIINRVQKPWLLLEKIFQLTSEAENDCKQKTSLYSYTEKILQERRKLNKNDQNPCLLDMFIEISKNNEEFQDVDIINEVCTFMLAGQDSTAAAISFTLYFIAKHQDVQEKILEEQNAIFGGKNREVTFEDLNKMKYLEQCVKESLRLCPSVPMVSRVLRQDVKLDSNVIPKGTNILITPFVTQRLPHIWENPGEFNPDRFSSDNLKNIHPYAFLPFSLGQRQCIGYKFAYIEIKTVLSSLLRNYKITVAKNYEFSLSYRVTLRMKGGLWLEFKER